MTQAINVDLGTNDSGSQSAFKRLEVALNGTIERLGKVEAKSEKMRAAQSGWLSSSVTGLASVVGGYVGIERAISGVISSQEEMLRQSQEIAVSYDKLFRGIAISGNMTEAQSKESKARVLKVAGETGADVTEAAQMSRKLIDSGVSAEGATGEILATALKTKMAMEMGGKAEDGGAAVEASAMFLQALGADVEKQMPSLLMGVQQAAEKGFGSFGDMTQLAPKVAGFAGKADPVELLSQYNVLRSKMGPDQASTGLKIFGDRLMGAGGDKERLRLLKQAGLKPEDVDLIGESLPEVIKRTSDAVQRMPETKRTPWMQQMFGTEAANAAQLLMSGQDQAPVFKKALTDRAGWEADVKLATSGKAAAGQKIKNQADALAAERDTGFEEKLAATKLADQRMGQSPFATGFSGFAARTVKTLFNASDETALSFAFGDAVKSESAATRGRDIYRKALEPDRGGDPAIADGMKALADKMDAQNKLMDEQNRLLREASRKPPVEIRKEDVPKVPVSRFAGRPK